MSVSGPVVAWSAQPSGSLDRDIFACDTSTGGLASCLSNVVHVEQESGQIFPAVTPENLVWTDFRHNPALALYGCRLAGGLENCAANAVPVRSGGANPAADGESIAFEASVDGIFICDVSGGLSQCESTLRRIGEVGATPDPSGRVVVWRWNGDIFAKRY